MHQVLTPEELKDWKKAWKEVSDSLPERYCEEMTETLEVLRYPIKR